MTHQETTPDAGISSEFPILYHAHHSLHSDDLDFWIKLAATYEDPILELGCGTGRVLLPLAAAGYSVTGIDLDSAMLALLAQQLNAKACSSANAHSRVKILQADITAFCLAQQYRLILLPCNTFSTLTPRQRQAVLKNVHSQLDPKGVFAVSMPNPVLLDQLRPSADLQPEEIFPHPTHGTPVQVSSAWHRDSQKLAIDWVYEFDHPDGQHRRISTQVIHNLTSVSTYIQEFQTQGFEIKTMFGNYAGRHYKRSSEQLIILAGLAE
jgi:SAM-dependent methyltransferase